MCNGGACLVPGARGPFLAANESLAGRDAKQEEGPERKPHLPRGAFPVMMWAGWPAGGGGAARQQPVSPQPQRLRDDSGRPPRRQLHWRWTLPPLHPTPPRPALPHPASSRLAAPRHACTSEHSPAQPCIESFLCSVMLCNYSGAGTQRHISSDCCYELSVRLPDTPPPSAILSQRSPARNTGREEATPDQETAMPPPDATAAAAALGAETSEDPMPPIPTANVTPPPPPAPALPS